MKKAVKILLIILAVLFLLLLLLAAGGSYLIGRQIFESSTQLVTNRETMEAYPGAWELEGFHFDTFKENYQIETRTLPSSFDDHTLPFDVITCKGNKDFVIMSHGLLGSRFSNYPTAEIFLKNGYNVISYDQRSSGENTAKRTTFGYWEKYDLIDCLTYVKKNYPEAEIIIWGESLGGATSILAVAHKDVQKDVSALILDCPLSSMEEVLEKEMAETGLPVPMDYLITCGNLVMKHKLGFTYEDVDCVRAASKITVPTLIFNSKADKITPFSMGEDIYKHLGSDIKELSTSETAAHIEIRNDERELYIEKILSFLNQ